MPTSRLPGRYRNTFAALAILLAVAGCDAPEDKAQSYFQRGMATMAAGVLDKAALDFRNVLKLDENHAQALLALAQIEEKRGNFEAAIKLYGALAERDAQNFDARVRLAQLFLAAGQADAASIHAGQAKRLKPADPRVLVIEAGLALSRGKLDEAARLANEVLRISPGDNTALMVLVSERVAASDPEGALKIIEQGLAADTRNLGLQILKLRTLQGMGDGPDVENQLVRLTELFPDTPAFHDGLVAWYLDKGRNADAERAARRFARSHAGDDAAQFKLALIVSRTAGAAAALAELKDIAESFPRDDEAKYTNLKIAEAQLADKAGRPEAAIAMLRDLTLSATDEDSRKLARVRLAQALAEMKQWDEAAEVSEAVLAGDARNAEALSVRGAVRLSRGDSAGAAADLAKAQAASPSAPNIALLLGEAHERLGSAALAEEQYSKALALSGFAPESGLRLARFLMRYGRAARAMEVMEDVRASGQADRQALLLLAQLKLSARDFEGAMAVADQVQTANASGTDGAAAQIRAAALAGLNRQEEAITLLQSSLPQSSDRHAAEVDLISAHVAAGDLAGAERLARARLESASGDARAHILYGSVLAAAGRGGEAEAAFKAAASLHDSSARGATALAKFYLREGQLEKAEDAALAGLAKSPASTPLRLLLAEILETGGKFDEAIMEYERLLQSDPASTVVANNLASLLSAREGDPKALERAFTIASRFQNSDVPQFLDTLGWIHHLRGDHHAALALLKRAAEKLPNSGTVHYHLGMVLKHTGQAELSATSLERAVALAANGDPAYLPAAMTALEQMKSTSLAN